MGVRPFQLQGMLEDQRNECELLKQQIGSERTSVNNLESLLHTNREKEFQSQLTAQELQSENQLLRDRLALNESKMLAQSYKHLCFTSCMLMRKYSNVIKCFGFYGWDRYHELNDEIYLTLLRLSKCNHMKQANVYCRPIVTVKQFAYLFAFVML